MTQSLQRAFHLYQQGNRAEAELACKAVLSEYPRHPDALLLMGLLEKDRGSFDLARSMFKKGLKKNPRHVHLLNSMGLIEKQLGNLSQAESHFKQALECDPNFFQARYGLAALMQAGHAFPEAKRLYLEVIAQQPKFVEALANLSSILESEHQLDEARSYASQALKINPNHTIARLTLANIATREKSYDEVIGLLLPLVQTQQLSPVNFAVFSGKCAFAYEKLGNYKVAFEFYRNANQGLFQAFQATMQNLNSLYSPDSVNCINDRVQAFDFSHRSVDVKTPVFLIGFPRSGTTLLDQVLSSHSQITVLEEKENLFDVYSRFPATDAGLTALERASEEELDILRDKYWSNVNREIDSKSLGSVIIDKLPLNAIALLHIFKLFPGAKIIVALRDPRDSVFSCYQQRFGMSQAMFQLLNLDTAVDYYDKVMSIIVKVRDIDCFPMSFVRYEEIVGNFDEEVNTLIKFLGLEWEDGLHDYRTTAKSRIISTPSAMQVIQPLYTSSIGKWQHYAPWISNSFDPLDEWVNEWGY